jgi:glutamate carboxypeptidase
MLLADAQARRDAMVAAIGELVQCESPTSDLDACRRVCTVAARIMGGWLDGPAHIEDVSGRPVVRWGAPQPRVLFLGHLDTVWPVGTIERLPWVATCDRLQGPGVFDMKAGVVIAIAALALMDDTTDIGLLLTTDEETGSSASRGVITEAIKRADAVFVFEPAAGEAFKTRRKGTSWYDITFGGRAAHAGLDPQRGVNALLEAALLVTDAVTWANPPAETTVTPTMLQAGTTANTVPDSARLTLDVRAWSADEQERVDEVVREWRLLHPEASMQISGGIDRAALEAESSAALFAQVQQVAADLGLPAPTEAAVGGASDGNLTAAAGIPTLDGMGAVGDGAHADHEWVSVHDLAPRAALAAGLAQRLLAD